MEALDNKNEVLRACVINEKTYWYSKDRRRNADIRKLCGEIYNNDPNVVVAATRRIWQSIKRNPAKLPTPLTLESLSLALQMHCDLDNPQDRHAFFALLQQHEIVRQAFYYFVTYNATNDVLLRGSVSLEEFWEHVFKRFPGFSPAVKGEMPVDDIQVLYDLEDKSNSGEPVTIELGEDAEDDKGKRDLDGGDLEPVATQPPEEPASPRNFLAANSENFDFALPNFQEFPNQSNDHVEDHLRASQLQGAEVALGHPTYPLQFELLYNVWNRVGGFGEKFAEKFTRDPKFVEQLFVETPALIDMISVDKLIQKAKTQPGIILGAAKKQPADNRLLEQTDEILVKQLLGQDWRVFGSILPVGVKLGKPLKAADGERLTQPQDIIAGYRLLPDPRKVEKIDPKSEVEFVDQTNLQRGLIQKLQNLIHQMKQAVLNGQDDVAFWNELRDQLIAALKTKILYVDLSLTKGAVAIQNDVDPTFVMLGKVMHNLEVWVDNGANQAEFLETILTLNNKRQKILNHKIGQPANLTRFEQLIFDMNQAVLNGEVDLDKFHLQLLGMQIELILADDQQDAKRVAIVGENDSFLVLLSKAILSIVSMSDEDVNDAETIAIELEKAQKILISEDDTVSSLYSRPICDFFVDAITYFSSANTDAVDKILATISAGHLENPLDQELRYRLYHPYTIHNMTEFWLAHFDKFLIAAGPHQEYLAHLLTHVKNPVRFLNALAKQDHLPRPARADGQAYQSRQEFIATNITKIMPVLSKISGKQAKKLRNQFLYKKRHHLGQASYSDELRIQVHKLIENYAKAGGVDQDDRLITLLDDDKIRGKLKLSPGEVQQLLTKGVQEGVRQHDPRFELIIAKDPNLWVQYQIFNPNLDVLPNEFPYLTARKALDAYESGGLMNYVEREYQKLEQHFHRNKVDAAYSDVRQLNSYQAMLIVSSNTLWKQVNPYQRYPVRAFLNRIPGLNLFSNFFDRENKKLVALNPLFRWKLEHDNLVKTNHKTPKKFTDYVLHTPGTMELVWSYDSDQPVARGEPEPTVSIDNLIIPQVKAEMGAIIPDIARGAELVTAYKIAEKSYPKSAEYQVNETLVDNLTVYNQSPVKVELGRQYPLELPNLAGAEYVGQNPLHVDFATTPKHREQFLKQINTPEKLRATRELLFQTPVMNEVSTGRIVEFLRSKEFGERSTNPLYYGRQILTRFPEKFVEILLSTDPVICAELPFVVKELSAVIQLILSHPDEEQILTPDVLIAFLKIGGALSKDVLESVYHTDRRHFESSLIEVFIANPPLAARLLNADFSTEKRDPDQQSADEKLKSDLNDLAVSQAKRCLNRIMLANRKDLSAQDILHLLQTDVETFKNLFMRENLAIGPEDDAVGRVLLDMSVEDFKHVIACVFDQDPVSGFIWLQYRYVHHRNDEEILALLQLPPIGLHYLDYRKALGDWAGERDRQAIAQLEESIDIIRQKITYRHVHDYILSCRADKSLLARQSLLTFFQQDFGRFYALLTQLNVDQIAELAEFNNDIFQLDVNRDDVQHPLLKYLVSSDTVCHAAVFIRCLRSGFRPLTNILLDVLMLKREVADRCQLLIEILQYDACDMAMLELLSPVAFNNVIFAALNESEFTHRLENNSRVLIKLLKGPVNLQTHLAEGLATGRIGSLLINAAGRAYANNDRDNAILQFVIKHQAALVNYLATVGDNAEISATITPEALVLLFNFTQNDDGQLFKLLCSSPTLLPRLVELGQQGAIHFDLTRHIKPLLRWIEGDQRLYQHCFNHPFLQDKFNQVFALLLHSPDQSDRALLRDLALIESSDKLKVVEQIGARDLKEFLHEWDGLELPLDNADTISLMELGMSPDVFSRNWTEYQQNPATFKMACRYRGDLEPWQQLLSYQWPMHLKISQSAIVDKMMASKELLDLAGFLQDLAADGNAMVELFKANHPFALAVLSDRELRQISRFSQETLQQLKQDESCAELVRFLELHKVNLTDEGLPQHQSRVVPLGRQSPLRFFGVAHNDGLNNDNNINNGQRGKAEDISLFK